MVDYLGSFCSILLIYDYDDVIFRRKSRFSEGKGEKILKRLSGKVKIYCRGAPDFMGRGGTGGGGGGGHRLKFLNLGIEVGRDWEAATGGCLPKLNP